MAEVLQATRGDVRIAWLTALAITIHLAESALPTILPGLKPGLANVVIVVALFLFGWRTAVWITLLRVLVGSLLLGTFLTPTFLLSLAGAAGSLLLMGLLFILFRFLPGKGPGAVGYSLLGAQGHMVAQFMVAYLFFIPHEAILHLLPVLMTAALLFGLVTGLIAMQVVQKMEAQR